MSPTSSICPVWAYSRISIEEATSVSTASQCQRISDFAAAMDLQITEIVVDEGQSAKSLKRPGMARIIDAVQRGQLRTLVVAKLDRLTRSVSDLSQLLNLFAKHNVALLSVNEHLDTKSAHGRLLVHLLASIAEWERAAIGERTTASLSYKRRMRRVYGRTPFGFQRAGDRLVPDHAEQEALMQIVQMRRHGSSFRVIATWLESHGFKPRQNGKTWHAASVRKILGSRMTADLLQEL